VVQVLENRCPTAVDQHRAISIAQLKDGKSLSAAFMESYEE
jgi:hypothetical protein